MSTSQERRRERRSEKRGEERVEHVPIVFYRVKRNGERVGPRVVGPVVPVYDFPRWYRDKLLPVGEG